MPAAPATCRAAASPGIDEDEAAGWKDVDAGKLDQSQHADDELMGSITYAEEPPVSVASVALAEHCASVALFGQQPLVVQK